MLNHLRERVIKTISTSRVATLSTHGAAGIRVPRVTGEQKKSARKLGRSRIQPGDLVFFRIGWGKYHVGIVVDEGRFVHAPSSGKKVQITRLADPYWLLGPRCSGDVQAGSLSKRSSPPLTPTCTAPPRCNPPNRISSASLRRISRSISRDMGRAPLRSS